MGDAAGEDLADALVRRRALKHERDTLNQQIRNQERKRLRILEKARSLSDADLASILAARAAAKAKAREKAKAKAKAVP